MDVFPFLITLFELFLRTNKVSTIIRPKITRCFLEANRSMPITHELAPWTVPILHGQVFKQEERDPPPHLGSHTNDRVRRAKVIDSDVDKCKDWYAFLSTRRSAMMG